MTIRRSRALALALAAGIAGVLIGRTTVLRGAPRAQVNPPHAPFAAPLTGRECKIERAELAATKAQLAHCMGEAPQPPEPDAPTAVETAAEEEVNRVRRNMEVLRNHPEDAVVVRRADHTVSYYAPNEPIPDGIIVARRLPGGELGFYAGPDAGPRSDPAAFRAPPPGSPLAGPVIERAPDGTIMVNGKPGAPVVQWMFGGKYEEDPDE
jgi:hypothetical protein